MNNKQLTELGEEVVGVSKLPKGWAQSSIGEVVVFNPKTDSLETMECAFSSMHSLGKSFRDKLGFEIKLWGEVKKAYTHFQDGDVLMAKVTPCFENGKAGIADNLPNKIGAGSSEFMVFRPSEAVINRYLLAWLSTNDFRRRATVAMTGSVGLKRVPKDFVLSEQIPLAPLPEQKRIADKLDATLARVDACRERLARVTPLLKRFRQSVLAAATSGQLTADWREQQNGYAAACKADYASSAAAGQESVGASSPCSTGPTAITADLPSGITDESGNLQNGACANKETPISAAPNERWTGQLTSSSSDCIGLTAWENVPLAQLCESMFDGPFGSNLKSDDYTAAGERVVRLENIGHLFFDASKETYVSSEKYSRLTKHTINAGDILFSSFVDEEVRVCQFPAMLPTKAINKADCFCIRVDKARCMPKFLTFRLACKSTYQQLKEQVHGATRPRINLTQLKQFNILLPSLLEQTEIVRRVETLFAFADRLEARLASANAATNRLTPSLLAKAFRGELVPQDPSDEPASELLKRLAAQRETAPKPKRSKKASA